MTCPQCGGRLATYALGGEEASVCEDCGYVGIAAEHRGDPRTVESWDEALRRFYRAHGSDGAPSVELQPPLSRPSSGAGESWDEALRRFYERTGDESGGEDDEDEIDAGRDTAEDDPRRDTDASPSDGSDGDGDSDSDHDESGADADSDADGTDTRGDVAAGTETADADVEAEADASGR